MIPWHRDHEYRRVRTPTVLQMEAVECGAAALSIVMSHYGRVVALEQLREACGVSRDGSKASNMVKAARSFGFTAKGFRKEPAELRDMPLPLIVFWNFNHFLVVEGFSRDKVFLNDPACGPRTVDHEEFDLSFTGVVLVIEPAPEFQPSGTRPGLLTGLKSRLPLREPALAFLILAGLALVIPGLALPVLTKSFIDEYLVARLDSWVKPLLIGIGLTALARAILTGLQQHYLTRFQAKLALSTTSRFFWHVLRLPVNFYVQRSSGDIASRVASNDRVAELLTGDLASTVLSVIMVVFYLALLFFYDPVLTLAGLLVAVGNVAFLRLISRRRRDASLKLANDAGKMQGISMNGLQLMETLKASGRESDFFNRWAGHQAKVLNGQQDLGRGEVLLGVVPPLLNAINTTLILALGGLRVMDGQMTIGMLVAYQSLMASFLAPVSQLVGLGAKIQQMEGDMTRLDDVFNYPRDPQAETDESEAQVSPQLQGYVELKNVSFGYSPMEPPLIENFSLSLRPGARVALVGSSGCGKSTLSKLVMGLHNPWQGEILFDGRPRAAIPRQTLVNSLAMVSQDILLFEGSLRDNISLWDTTLPEEQLVQAAKDACIHDVITSRPGGYDALVSEGGNNFSGGQRQRIGIARALAVNPRILVLDEATNALDASTEKWVDDNLRRRGCTCLIVAHRLSTIRDCDEIIVLDQGRVIERGTHESMCAAGGPYAELIKAE